MKLSCANCPHRRPMGLCLILSALGGLSTDTHCRICWERLQLWVANTINCGIFNCLLTTYHQRSYFVSRKDSLTGKRTRVCSSTHMQIHTFLSRVYISILPKRCNLPDVFSFVALPLYFVFLLLMRNHFCIRRNSSRIPQVTVAFANLNKDRRMLWFFPEVSPLVTNLMKYF